MRIIAIFKNSLLTILAIIFFFSSSFLYADETPEEIIDAYIQKGIRATVLQQYQLAISFFDSLRYFLKDDPRPDFYQAAALQSKMMDYENYEDEPEFFRLIQKVISITEKQIEQNPNVAKSYFFKGGAYSYRGYYYAKRKDYARGLRDSITGIKYLEKAVSIDSTLYDAYLAIGTYKYYRGRLTRYVNWLPFVSDQSKEGLEMIHKAIEKGRYSRAAAINGLIWLDIDEKKYTRAIQTALKMLNEYPASRFFLWPLAGAYFKAGYYKKSNDVYRDLQDSYQNEEKNNHYNEMICGYKMMKANENLDKPEEVCEISNQLLAISLNDAVRKRLKDKLKEIVEVNKGCSNTL